VARFDDKKKVLRNAARGLDAEGRSRLSPLRILLVAATVAFVGGGFLFVHRHFMQSNPVIHSYGDLILVGPPPWLNEELKEKIGYAATADGEDLRLDEDAAVTIQNNLRKHLVWLADPKVRVNPDHIEVSGRWRKPLAQIEVNDTLFYLDAESVVLDYVEVPELPIIQIAGVRLSGAPTIGETLASPDIAAAMAILHRMDKMDRLVTADAPLLLQIKSINIANFQGRLSKTDPHITMKSVGGTDIVWGAELDAWSEQLEASDEEKLAKLYAYYRQSGSLDDGVRFINLREPRDRIPRPAEPLPRAANPLP